MKGKIMKDKVICILLTLLFVLSAVAGNIFGAGQDVEAAKASKKLGKVLIVYFSVPEKEAGQDETLDAVTSASLMVSGKKNVGHMQFVASVIKKNVKADTFRIQPKEAYPIVHSDLTDYALQEQESDARPKIKNKIKNIDQYDTVFIGYPIWWSDMPQIMYTFFDTYDLSGKQIIPFTVHGGSGLSGTVSRIKKLEPNATVSEKALSIERESVSKSRKKIEKWVKSLI